MTMCDAKEGAVVEDREGTQFRIAAVDSEWVTLVMLPEHGLIGVRRYVPWGRMLDPTLYTLARRALSVG